MLNERFAAESKEKPKFGSRNAETVTLYGTHKQIRSKIYLVISI